MKQQMNNNWTNRLRSGAKWSWKCEKLNLDQLTILIWFIFWLCNIFLIINVDWDIYFYITIVSVFGRVTKNVKLCKNTTIVWKYNFDIKYAHFLFLYRNSYTVHSHTVLQHFLAYFQKYQINCNINIFREICYQPTVRQILWLREPEQWKCGFYERLYGYKIYLNSPSKNR